MPRNRELQENSVLVRPVARPQPRAVLRIFVLVDVYWPVLNDAIQMGQQIQGEGGDSRLAQRERERRRRNKMREIESQQQ